MNWEKIDDYTIRAKIKGGWLVKSYEFMPPGNERETPSASMCFVPDPMHGWKL